jgi:thiosulfate dehydrogenase (quinone) large subunit
MTTAQRETPRTTDSDAPTHRGVPSASRGWTGLTVRLLFGVIWGVDAYLKWRPGYRHSFIDTLKSAAQGQPSFLHGWFHFWIKLQSGAPGLFATLTGLAETLLALVLLLGVARRAGYVFGAVYALLIWAVGEGFGGPYTSSSTDVGTGVVYTMMFLTLLVFAPPARRERLALDKPLVRRLPWWRFIAEPHAVDRVHGAPRVEPVVVGTMLHHDDGGAGRPHPPMGTLGDGTDPAESPPD